MTLIGFPHSEISGSTPACGSPKLIAASHVLHRLLTPWHPPCALTSLTANLLHWSRDSLLPRKLVIRRSNTNHERCLVSRTQSSTFSKSSPKLQEGGSRSRRI